jgi:UDP-N-acetylmuramoyl-L-alanyl-D-glutamate--2,6-diaminopimelate ligase
VGSANLQNILGAVGVGFALGLPPEKVIEGVHNLKTVPGRLEKVEQTLGIAILVDYAHSPDALEKVLGAVRPLTRGKVITVFGCGGDRDRGKRPLMGEIAARLSDLVVLTSDNPRTEEPMAILQEIETGVRQTPLQPLRVSPQEPGGAEFTAQNLEPEAERGYCVEADRPAAIRLTLRLARPGDVV